MMFTIIPMTRYLSRIVMIPTAILVPAIICFTLVGPFAPRAYLFRYGAGHGIRILGLHCPEKPASTGRHSHRVILGPNDRTYFLRALRISEGDMTVFFTSPVGNVLWALLLFSWRRR
jgi:putative tricarboxylic transport membrane protein